MILASQFLQSLNIYRRIYLDIVLFFYIAMNDGQLKLLVGHSRNMDTQGVYGHEVEGQREQLAQASTDAFKLAHGQ